MAKAGSGKQSGSGKSASASAPAKTTPKPPAPTDSSKSKPSAPVSAVPKSPSASGLGAAKSGKVKLKPSGTRPAPGGVVVPPPPQRDIAELLANGADLVPKDWRNTPSHLVAKLSKTELAGYLRLLVQRRSQLAGDLSTMGDEALRRSGNGDLSSMPIHMAELGSDSYEQESTLNLLVNEQQILQEVEQAIFRIADGTFGVCAATGRPIGTARLDAKPWAKHCIEHVREQERRGRRPI